VFDTYLHPSAPGQTIFAEGLDFNDRPARSTLCKLSTIGIAENVMIINIRKVSKQERARKTSTDAEMA
jgi:hypothetical protein